MLRMRRIVVADLEAAGLLDGLRVSVVAGPDDPEKPDETTALARGNVTEVKVVLASVVMALALFIVGAGITL